MPKIDIVFQKSSPFVNPPECNKYKIKKYKLQYTKTTFYQLEIWKTFGINPFYCFNCKIKMKVRRISYFNISKGSICWKEYCW